MAGWLSGWVAECRYVTPRKLQQFLLQRVDEGFVFPINPKWILCDAGWYKIYEVREEKSVIALPRPKKRDASYFISSHLISSHFVSSHLILSYLLGHVARQSAWAGRLAASRLRLT